MTLSRRSPLVLALIGLVLGGAAGLAFLFVHIERPTSFLVLSIEDHGIMEFKLHFRRSS